MGKKQLPPDTGRKKIKMPPNIRRKLAEKANKDSSKARVQTTAAKPWLSPDGVFCNTAYAAEYVCRSVSRLQSMRCEGKGPKFIKNGRAIYYRVADVRDFVETGASVAS